jgi:hypothetical protein
LVFRRSAVAVVPVVVAVPVEVLRRRWRWWGRVPNSDRGKVGEGEVRMPMPGLVVEMVLEGGETS